MVDIQGILAEIAGLGVSIAIKNGRLRFERAPVPPEYLSRLRQHPFADVIAVVESEIDRQLERDAIQWADARDNPAADAALANACEWFEAKCPDCSASDEIDWWSLMSDEDRAYAKSPIGPPCSSCGRRGGRHFDHCDAGLMRFGKYKGTPIDQVPASYMRWLEWAKQSDHKRANSGDKLRPIRRSSTKSEPKECDHLHHDAKLWVDRAADSRGCAKVACRICGRFIGYRRSAKTTRNRTKRKGHDSRSSELPSL